MKKVLIPCVLLISHSGVWAQELKDYKSQAAPTEEEVKSILANRQTNSKKLAKTQDELSADVQELIESQTNEKVIQLFEEVEGLMANVTDNLDEANTGKDTIFNENKIIEKIFEAAKEKSK